MATNEDPSRQRDRLRHRCPSCEIEVAADDDACAACGTERPDRGWVRVTELVVHGGFRGEPDDVPTIEGAPAAITAHTPRPSVHRTVYLEAPGMPGAPTDLEGNHTVGLVATFMATFVLSTMLVLYAFGQPQSSSAASPAAQPPPAAQVLGPSPVPAMGGASPEGESDEPAFSEPAQPAPAPSPVLRSPQQGSGSRASRSVPTPAPVAPPPPARGSARKGDLPPSLAALGGRYSGTMNGEPVTFTFDFEPGGSVTANITPRGGMVTQATGTYRLEGSIARLSFVDDDGLTMSSYTGRINGRTVDGQLTLSTGEIKYFQAKR